MIETPLSELHLAAGATLGLFDDCVLPQRFTSLNAEYAAAKNAVALLDTHWHAILMLGGRDRVKYLHAISSNEIKALAEGQGMLALLLTPQGHILAEIEVYALADQLLVFSHASRHNQTIATLKKYIIGSQVQIEDQTMHLGSCAVEGPHAATVVEQACGVALASLSELSVVDTAVQGIRCRLLRRSHFGQPGAEVLANRSDLPALWMALLDRVREHGGGPIGMDAFHALRLEARLPWFPADFNEAMIPHEAALENTHISFTKGCYTGQEIVERVRSRGHVNRKRVSLRFSTSAPPLPGTKLTVAGAEVGIVTSAAFSPGVGTAIGIGYLRREHLASGTTVEFEGGTAKVS